MAFPVILIPALTGLSSATNPHEPIRIRGSEASWLGIPQRLHLLNIGRLELIHSASRQYIVLLHRSRERSLGNIHRATGSKESDACRQYPTFTRMAAVILRIDTHASFHRNVAAWPGCRTDGGTDHHIRWRSLVSCCYCPCNLRNISSFSRFSA